MLLKTILEFLPRNNSILNAKGDNVNKNPSSAQKIWNESYIWYYVSGKSKKILINTVNLARPRWSKTWMS